MGCPLETLHGGGHRPGYYCRCRSYGYAAFLRELPPRVPPDLEDEAPRLLFLFAPAAVSRLTSLLKLLFCPPAVVSCTRSARPLSSNFWNQSSHSICSSDCSPL